MDGNQTPRISVIIPALNEAGSIGPVVASVLDKATEVIVVDNGSTDGTGAIAEKAGARVICVQEPGSGRSCQAGVASAAKPDIIVFMDGDAADDPADFESIVAPVHAGRADIVIGSRLNGAVEKGALTPPQRFGNMLACFLMRLIWNGAFTDLGPFRAIRRQSLQELDMASLTYGWTVEMQVRAMKKGLRCVETPVRYRRRIGVSKISGTVKGVIFAGGIILGVIAREALHQPRVEPKTAHAYRNEFRKSGVKA